MVTLISEFDDCYYDNGWGGAVWKASKKDNLVKGCTLRLTEEKLELHNGRKSISCPWGGVGVQAAPSTRGNAVLTVTLRGDKGGTAKIVVPEYSPNALWAEMWRVAPVLRGRIEQMKPEMLAVTAKAEAVLNYLGGYPLHPIKSFVGVWLVLDQFGASVRFGGIRGRRKIFLPWKDVIALSVEGMMDQQRQRSLARTVEFGALGGLAGKKVKSAYVTITTGIGAAAFHTDKMTVPELRAKYAAVLPVAEAAIDKRNVASTPVSDGARPAGVSPTSVADELAKLAKLKSDGILNDDEFAAQKAKLLSS